MKILIINSSPRRGGNIDTMLSAMKEEAIKQEYKVEEIRVDALRVEPCCGCMVCRTKGECSLPVDDAQRVLELLRWCDVVVVGAPCYWGNMPGMLKVLFDRMVYGMMSENRWGIPQPLHKGKRAIVVTTSTTSWPFNLLFRQTRGVVCALREIFHYSGFRIVKTVQVGGTKRKRKVVTERVLKKCRRAVSALNKA